MSSKQSNGTYSAEKASRSYSVAVLFVVALIAGTGYLHYSIVQKQKMLVQATATVQQQITLAQRVGTLVRQYHETRDDKLLAALKETNAALFGDHEALGPYIRSLLKPGTPQDPSAVLSAVKGFVDASFTYAAVVNSPQSSEAQTYADLIITQSENGLPLQLNSVAANLVAVGQQEIGLLSKISFGLLGLMLCILLYASLGIAIPAMAYITRQREHIEHMAATDLLTGLYNRAMLFKVSAMLISGAKRHKRGLTALVVDIDHFRKINETFGRSAGDAAIRAVARTLSETLRNSDVIGRVGGEEFAVFLPSTDEYRATFVAEKLRSAIENMPFSVKDAVVLLRVSIGIAEMQENHKAPEEIVRAAEAALQRAKDEGRNRVATFSGKAAAPVAANEETAPISVP
jgi:diguanylate cyclase (GGDEF)-like protein